MKVTALLLALAAMAGCKDEPRAARPDPCVEAQERYIIHARQVAEDALATVTDPQKRSDHEEELEVELRGAAAKFPAACAEIGGERLLRCVRLVQAARKEAYDRAELANDADCKAAGDALHRKLYGAAPRAAP